MNAPEIVLTVFGTPIALIVLGAIYVFRDGKGDRQSGEHHWFGSSRFQAALTARYGPVRDRLDDLTDRFHAAPTHVPAPVAPSPEAPHTPPPAGAGTSTRMHAVEIHPVHKYAAAAWQHASATPNQAKGYWQAADRGDFTESAWTKRSALDLAIKLAREQTDAGFDAINPAGIVDYFGSGVMRRLQHPAVA